jgi:hypothetical protein
MKRAGAIELNQHFDWNTWRDVRVPLDEPATDAFLVHVESRLRRGVGGFESMEFEPGRPLLVLVLNEPRDDIDVVTSEIDDCISAAAQAGT